MRCILRCTWILLLGALGASADGRSAITFSTLLEEMTNFEALTRFPDPPFSCKQFSSYDRAAISPEDRDTWFANQDRGMYLRVEETRERKEWVMMDADGPGAVVRIWSANPEGTLRVYLDHARTPVIETPMADALSGRWRVGPPLSAERSKGYNLYLPIPYAEHCKITSDSGDLYYQINYRTYIPDTAVASLTPESFETCADLIQETNERLLREVAHGLGFGLDDAAGSKAELLPEASGITAQMELEAGDSFSVNPGRLFGKAGLPAGSKAITRLEIRKESDQRIDFTRSIVLEAEFDGEKTIWVPLTDFFGMGVGTDRVKDLYRSCMAGKSAIALWRMPYEKDCTLTLHNLSGEAVRLGMVLKIEDRPWDDRSMHFYAQWHYEFPIPTRPMRDWNYIRIRGKGVYIGDSLAVMNPSPIWWGEGDEKIYVDGETFPSHFGTGTEDYYGYAWCNPRPFEDPFHGQPRCDGFEEGNNLGHTTISRVRALDAIPFNTSLQFDMEVWHWRECEMAYGATTFFYARPGATNNRLPQPEAAAAPIPEPPPPAPPFKIEGALECEEMEILDQSGEFPVEAQDLRGFARGKFSNETHLFVQPKSNGAWIKIAFPVERPGKYRVLLYATRSWDYGKVRFFVGGHPAGEVTDLYSGETNRVRPTGPIDLGVFEPVLGRMVLRVEGAGSHPDSAGTASFFGLDCIVLDPQDED